MTFPGPNDAAGIDGQKHWKNDLPAAQMPVLVRSLRGLTLDEAHRILTQAILEKSCLDVATLDAVHEAKAQLIKDQGVIEFLKPETALDRWAD